MSATEPMILIHGAWQGSWVWDGFIAALEQRAPGRYIPIPVDLPGNGADGAPPESASMESYLVYLDAIIARLTGPFTLVAHSGGGVVASALAERYPERVRCIVYIAAMMLPSGMGFGEVVQRLLPQDPTASGITPWLLWPVEKKVSVVPPEAIIAFFLQDYAPGPAVIASRRFTPQGEQGRALTAQLTPERYGTIPRLYVQATQDRSVTFALQKLMCELAPGAVIRSVDTGHAPHVVAPDILLDAMLP